LHSTGGAGHCARGGGSIITTGDVATDVWFPRLSAYRSAKAAVLVLTQHAANEFRESRINVNSVMPGATATRMSGQFYASLGDGAADFAASTAAHYENDAAASGKLDAPEAVPPVGVFLCTEEGREFTGYSFQISSGRIGVVSPSTEVEYVVPTSSNWTLPDIAEQLPPLLHRSRSLMR
jgi:NAD(P)-dependent dehydrogenase (short-subunit alcohol dehydrogenase family)